MKLMHVNIFIKRIHHWILKSFSLHVCGCLNFTDFFFAHYYCYYYYISIITCKYISIDDVQKIMWHFYIKYIDHFLFFSSYFLRKYGSVSLIILDHVCSLWKTSQPENQLVFLHRKQYDPLTVVVEYTY